MSAWTAVLPVVGVLVGAILQHWFSRAAETSKQIALLRSAAYVDYLRSVARLAHSSTTDERGAALRDAADAKARIAIYGKTPVVRALARFEEGGPALDNAESKQRFVEFVSAAGVSKASAGDLELVLLGRPRALSESEEAYRSRRSQ